MNSKNVEVPARNKKYAGFKNTRRKKEALGPSWSELNADLTTITTEDAALDLFKREKARRPQRPVFLKRIWGRYTKLRAERERTEILA